MNLETRATKWGNGRRLALECKACGDVIYSTFTGQFVACWCGSNFIDETPFYVRHTNHCRVFYIMIEPQNSLYEPRWPY